MSVFSSTPEKCLAGDRKSEIDVEKRRETFTGAQDPVIQKENVTKLLNHLFGQDIIIKGEK